MKCRCCGGAVKKKLLSFMNMPKSAQFFPSKEDCVVEKGVNLYLYQCQYCGLLQLSGEPVPYYRDVIRATNVSDEMRLFRERQYASFVDRYHLKNKKIIEIGCGCGEYMSFMETVADNVFGIENSVESTNKARASGHKVFCQYVKDEDTVIEGAPYAAFYCMNFLEHIPYPCDFLRGIANNLCDDAVGLVEVPNFNYIIENKLYSELIQDHLSYFTQDTLKKLLELCGFEILSCQSIWYEYIISVEVRKRKSLDLQDFYRQCDFLKENVKSFFERMFASNRKVAVWGAGHQALANLSLLDIYKNVECVIDSAPFKQGKYTPATHIPTVSPKVLNGGEIDTVLIMAGGYSDEINNMIRERYPYIKTCVLTDNGIIFL